MIAQVQESILLSLQRVRCFSFQNHTENAVAKTIPVTESASEEEVAMIFLLGYQLGVKGIRLNKI